MPSVHCTTNCVSETWIIATLFAHLMSLVKRNPCDIVITKLIFLVLYFKWAGDATRARHLTTENGIKWRGKKYAPIEFTKLQMHCSGQTANGKCERANQKSRLSIISYSVRTWVDVKIGAQFFTSSNFHSNIFSISIDFFFVSKYNIKMWGEREQKMVAEGVLSMKRWNVRQSREAEWNLHFVHKSETFATQPAISFPPTNNENPPKNGIKVNTSEIFVKLLPNSKFDMQIIKSRTVQWCTVHTHTYPLYFASIMHAKFSLIEKPKAKRFSYWTIKLKFNLIVNFMNGCCCDRHCYYSTCVSKSFIGFLMITLNGIASNIQTDE